MSNYRGTPIRIKQPDINVGWTYHGMTSWYHPVRMLATGRRVGNATTFGKMFDRREILASLDPFDDTFFRDNMDFSTEGTSPDAPQEPFWFDYCADTGDGWWPTYAVARLLARRELTGVLGAPGADNKPTPFKEILKQGRVLVFGGDMMYPTPSQEIYQEKLFDPFNAANLHENEKSAPSEFNKTNGRFPDRVLFAAPGNHDWYDGLTAFIHWFCNKSPARPGSGASPGHGVCGRATAQRRSYFALKLPNDWWLCAFDAQLEGYIDMPQIRYFEYIAQTKMTPQSNIILCVAGPVWAYSRYGEGWEGFPNFAFASLIVSGALPYKGHSPERQHNVRLVLTGDAHHYSHFVEGYGHGIVHYLTCGLGGAFLSGTHWLENTSPKVRWRPAPPLLPYDPAGETKTGPLEYTREFKIDVDTKGREKIYPSRCRSIFTVLLNLFFVCFNWQFGATLGGLALLMGWLLYGAALANNSLLAAYLQSFSVKDLLVLLFATPWPVLIILGIFAALHAFAKIRSECLRLLVAGIHTAAHIALFFGLLIGVARWIVPLVPMWVPDVFRDTFLIMTTAVFEGILGPSLMGLYLIAFSWHGHWDEAHSSLHKENHKGFLRMKIDSDGTLTVYPIVIKHVPREDDGTLTPQLVELPISIPKKAGP
jgi:hypothetical protein